MSLRHHTPYTSEVRFLTCREQENVERNISLKEYIVQEPAQQTLFIDECLESEICAARAALEEFLSIAASIEDVVKNKASRVAKTDLQRQLTHAQILLAATDGATVCAHLSSASQQCRDLADRLKSESKVCNDLWCAQLLAEIGRAANQCADTTTPDMGWYVGTRALARVVTQLNA